MMSDELARGGEGRWFLGRVVPAPFAHRVVTIAPGTARAYDEVEWRDAIVVVERGEVELEAVDGSRHRFAGGALVWFHGVELRAIHSAGDEPAVLVAVSRRARRSARPLTVIDLDGRAGDEVGGW